VDTNYRLLTGNSTFRHNIDEALGRSIMLGESVVSPNGSQSINDEWRSYYDRALLGEQFQIETRRRFGDTSRWMEYRFNPIRAGDGDITGVTVYGRDVTLRRQGEEQIKNQLAEITHYYDNAPIGLVVLDTALRFVRVNKRLADINGIPAADHIGKTVGEILPGLAEQARQIADEILRTGKAVTAVELTGETPADPGVTHYWLEGWYPLHHFNGEISGFNIIVEDITERRHAETALRQALQKLDAHMENSPVAVIEFDQEFRVTRWSREAVRIFGWSQAEVMGKGIAELRWVHDDEVAQVQQISEKMVSGEQPSIFNVNRNYRKDGAVILCEWYSSSQYDEAGRLQSVLSFVLDITQRRQAEAMLRQSQNNLARSQQIGHLGSWEWDVPNQTLFWSDELYRIFGVTPEFPLDYAGIEARLHPDDRALNTAKVQEALTLQGPIDFEFRIVRPDGEIRHIEQNIVVSHAADGRPGVLFGIMQDVTQRKQAEQEREQLLAQLAQAQKMESVGRLAGGIAHDFNNLLAVIVMRAELAMSLTTPASPLYRNLSVIFSTAHRSADLVRQLLGFAGKQTIAPKALDLNAAAGSALPTLRKIVSEEIELIWQPGQQLWTIKMDPAQVEQILANLCANARDAIEKTGSITLATKNVTLTQPVANRTTPIPPGDYVVLTVADTGSGMDQALLTKIFEPFFTTKDVDKGTGLGLATVEGIVQQNRGHVAVSSTLGAGTTFRIYLPRLAESVPAPAGDLLPALPQGHGETVLFVEDEEVLLHMGIEALESLGYRVLAAATPDEALQLAKMHAARLDLLITDIIMPRMNGQELAERVATLRPGVARLFVSGYPADFVAQRGVLGADVHFLQKPFSLFDFATKIREALATK
jgi:PAS domain S-box-containing protein